MPFFLIAHLLSFIFNYPLDGYSYFYQVFAGLAGLFYGFSGILILRKVLKRNFSEKITLLTLTAIIFGTNLFNYMTSNSLFSHAFSFFLISLLIYYIPIYFDSPKSIKKLFVLAIIFGLIILVRLINVFTIFIVLLYGIDSFNKLKIRIISIFKNYRFLIFFTLIVVIVFTPQLITWKLTFNKWIVYSYGNVNFRFSTPYIANSLFSVRRGLFFYSPILIFSIFGFFLPGIKKTKYLLSAIVVLLIMVFLNSSVYMWWFGSSFGNRSYIEFFPLLSIPLAIFFEYIKNKKHLLIIITVLSILFVLSTLIRMYWYWSGILPADYITPLTYRDIFINIIK